MINGFLTLIFEIINNIGKGNTKKMPKLKGDTNYSCADISKLKKLYKKFNPIKIEEGIKLLINKL